MKKQILTENNAEQTPSGGVLVGKRQGQTIIHNKGTLSGYLVGKTHAEGGIKAVNKSTGQPLEMQGGEVVITAPAVSDQTKNEFNGKMMTNREILSQINVNGGGVAFAKDGMEIPKNVKRTGASYNYGGKTMTDHEIYKYITGGLIAPNGKSSNLTPEQYKLVRTPEFKEWFGDWENDPKNSSKVVDENGEPLVVYHGTNKKFNIFKINERTPYSFFAKNKEYAETYTDDEYSVSNPKMYECFLNIRTPLDTSKNYEFNNESFNLYYFLAKLIYKDVKEEKIILPQNYYLDNKKEELKEFIENQNTKFGSVFWFVLRDDGSNYNDYLKGYNKEYAEKNKKKKRGFLKNFLQFLNYDGVVQYENVYGEEVKGNYKKIADKKKDYASLVFAVFNSNQIKLADGTNTTFDSENDDIRYADGGETESLIKNSKRGNTPARDLNNYNDVMDLQADGMVGAETGLYADGGLIAPNGNKTNLTPEQYKLVRTPEFKEWFGDWETQYKSTLINMINGRLIYDGKDIGIFEISKKDRIVEIDRLYIDDKFQKKGIGRACIQYIFNNYNTEVIEVYPLSDAFWLKSGVFNVRKDGYFQIDRKKYSCSKVVDENGEPLVVYHGTYSDKPFYTFDFNKADLGFHFGTYEQAKNRSETKLFFKGHKTIINSFFLNIRKIWNVTDIGEWEYPQRYLDEFILHKIIRETDAKKLGFFNLIYKKDNEKIRKYILDKFKEKVGFEYNNKYEGNGKSFIVLEKNQIKLADGTNTTFNGMNPDIRFADGGEIDENFKKWFDGSKVVDKKGNPLVVYHGSPDLRGLKSDYIFKTIDERYGISNENRAYFFTDSYGIAKSYADPRRAFDYQNAEEGIVELYLSLKNPLIVDANNQIWRKFEKEINGEKIVGTRNLISYAQSKDYDGVIVKNVRDYYTNNEKKTSGGNVYVAFEPNQIKLADGTNTTFDSENDDIRFAEGGIVGADFTFLKSNPMQRARALKVLDKLIRHEEVVMPNYKFIEKLPKNLEVGVSKLFSRKSEKGYVEKLSIGEFIMDSKAELDYYQYLQNGGSPYSKYLVEIKEDELKRNEADKIIFDEQNRLKQLKDIENQKNSEIAKKNQIKELIENGADAIIKRMNAPRYNQIEKYKTQRQTNDVKQDIDYHIRMIEQTERQVKDAYKIAYELYTIVDGEVQPKYNWSVGDKIKVEGYVNQLPAEIDTEIIEINENRFGELNYKVEKKEGINNQYLTYDSIYPASQNISDKNEYEYVLTQRPFDIGTYPKDNFLRFEEQNYQYGVVIYSKPLPIKEMEHYSLCPITEIKDFENKFLYYIFSDTKQKIQVKLIPDERKGYFVDIIYYEGDKVEDTEMMSAISFLKKVQEGDYKLENEIQVEPQNNYETKTLDELIDILKIKYSNMPIDSPKSEDEKLLNKLIAKKFSLINEEIRKKREEKKSFESEGSTEGKGKLYEFFTPQIVADKMLALAQHYGFKGGNVLEPATGNGRLIKNLKDANITAFEISKDNFEILKREFPNAELYNFNFEKAFLKEPRFNTLINRKGTETWLKNAPFDLVLANPPYGKFSGLYSSYFNFKGQVEHFFILQTLYLLKKGGLGVYLIPSSFLRNGVAYNDIKRQIFEIAEFVDAYRLPSNIFEKTQIGTDILILRKK
jgi:GNAT superfamily N-acetyltransferase